MLLLFIVFPVFVSLYRCVASCVACRVVVVLLRDCVILSCCPVADCYCWLLCRCVVMLFELFASLFTPVCHVLLCYCFDLCVCCTLSCVFVPFGESQGRRTTMQIKSRRFVLDVTVMLNCGCTSL